LQKKWFNIRPPEVWQRDLLKVKITGKKAKRRRIRKEGVRITTRGFVQRGELGTAESSSGGREGRLVGFQKEIGTKEEEGI